MPVLSRPFTPQPAQQLEGVSTYSEALGASIDETLATGPTAGAVNALKLWGSENLGFDESPFPTFGPTASQFGFGAKAPLVTNENAKQKVKDAGLEGQVPLDKYPDGIRSTTLDMLISLNKDKVRRQTLASQYDGWSPQVAGMLIGSVIDPANVALAFVPVVGEARYAKLLKDAGSAAGRFGVRSGVGAAEGLVGSALAEPLIYAGQQQWRNDYDAYDSFLNVAGGAVFGSLLHAGVGMVRDAFGNPSDFSLRPQEAAEPVAPQVGEGAVAPEAPQTMFVYHGTPSTFDRFTLDKVGSGEGNQVFGWGAYFASKVEVAESYRKALTGIDKFPGAASAEAMLKKTGGDRVEAVRMLKRKGDEDAVTFLRRDMNLGNTYQVEVPSEENFLDFDKPLSQQPQKVRDALDQLPEIRELLASDPKGSDIYRAMGEPQAASEALLAAGVPGLRYLDGQSRAKGGSHNYVVWDEAAIGAPTSADLLAPSTAQRAFVAGLDANTQAAALRQAVAQAIDGRPIDVTPAMLSDPQFRGSPTAYSEALNRAKLNTTQVDGANVRASNEAEARVSESEGEALATAKALLDEDKQQLQSRGVESEPVEDDLKITKDAVKAATMCLMRANG